MPKKLLSYALIIMGLFLFVPVYAVPAAHLVISQAQITGGPGKTTNDFVELYNPTSQDIDLEGYRLVKRTKTGASDTLLKSWTDSALVKAHGYYLWANSDFADIAVTPDVTTSGTLAADNGVALRKGPNDTGEIIDSIGWGEAANIFVEGQAFAQNPEAGQSLERKPGGGQGNGEDTDNNAEDFFLQTAAHPRNAQSPIEPALEGEGQEALPEEDAQAEPEAEQAAPSPAAGSGGIFALEISEIFPNPKGPDSGQEWVEIYNAGGGDFNLSDWYLDDDGEEDVPGSGAWRLPEGTEIAGGGYLQLVIPKGKFALNNSGGDAVRLFDSVKNLRLRQFYAGAAKENYSYAKNTNGSWEWTETPTPGAANIFAVLSVYADTLLISEVLPNPEGDDVEGEFIELYNYGTDSINLAEWAVADERKKYTIAEEDFDETEIPAGGYFVIYREVSGIALNNSGPETAKLLNPVGELVDSIGFDAKGREGEAYAWELNDIYRWTDFPTPGLKNKLVAITGLDDEEDPETVLGAQAVRVQLAEVRTLPVGTVVETSGTVSVPPGVFGDGAMYLAGSGMKVTISGSFDLNLKLGDAVSLQGQIREIRGERELRVQDPVDIGLLGQGYEVVPHTMATGEAGEDWEGALVAVSGTVTRSEGETFFLDDGSGEARIYIRESTGIVKPRMRKGERVSVIGIVSQFDENYRVMPRFQDDLMTGEAAGAATAEGLPRTGRDLPLILAFLLLSCYIVFVFFRTLRVKALRAASPDLIIKRRVDSIVSLKSRKDKS